MQIIPTMETARLRLRGHRPEDFDAYARMWAEPEVVRFIANGVPLSREAAWARFLRYAGMWQYMGFGFFLLEDKESGGFLGEVGFHEIRREVQPSIEGTLEAGWVLTAAAQGMGLAEEAMRRVIAWGEAEHPGQLMTCIIDPQNGASMRVAGKLGFHEVARTDYHGSIMAVLHRTSTPKTPAPETP